MVWFYVLMMIVGGALIASATYMLSKIEDLETDRINQYDMCAGAFLRLVAS